MASVSTSRQWRMLGAALVVSIIMHFAPIAWSILVTPKDVALEAGGSITSVVTLGDAFSDQLISGTTASTVKPVPTETLQAEPLKPTSVSPAEPTPVANTEPEEVSKAIKPLATQALTSPVVNSAAEGNFVEAQKATEEATKVQKSPQQPVQSQPTETLTSKAARHDRQEVPQRVSSVDTQAAEKVSETIPVPRTRPKPLIKKPPKQRETKSKPPQKAKITKRASSSQGAGGKSSQNKQKGGARASGKDSEAGNAATSNYKGKVQRKLRRARRGVRGSGRATVIIAFTIGRNGQLLSARIAKGSGKKNLDSAALDTVRRASPFPKFLPGMTQSKLKLSVPIQFK
ncbi:MAG: energy transducer TonB [Rhodobacteraceae bacterium]|nr:energy transducer TonB [Paracoccaceae bacterium]